MALYIQTFVKTRALIFNLQYSLDILDLQTIEKPRVIKLYTTLLPDIHARSKSIDIKLTFCTMVFKSGKNN